MVLPHDHRHHEALTGHCKCLSDFTMDTSNTGLMTLLTGGWMKGGWGWEDMTDGTKEDSDVLYIILERRMFDENKRTMWVQMQNGNALTSPEISKMHLIYFVSVTTNALHSNSHCCCHGFSGHAAPFCQRAMLQRFPDITPPFRHHFTQQRIDDIPVIQMREWRGMTLKLVDSFTPKNTPV